MIQVKKWKDRTTRRGRSLVQADLVCPQSDNVGPQTGASVPATRSISCAPAGDDGACLFWMGVALAHETQMRIRVRATKAALPAALAVLLDRRTRHRAVGAEHTAVPRLGLESGSTPGAIIEELAGVGRHGLGGLVPTGWTSQDRLKLHQRDARTTLRSGRSR